MKVMEQEDKKIRIFLEKKNNNLTTVILLVYNMSSKMSEAVHQYKHVCIQGICAA
jgi:hypothetical protein